MKGGLASVLNPKNLLLTFLAMDTPHVWFEIEQRENHCGPAVLTAAMASRVSRSKPGAKL